MELLSHPVLLGALLALLVLGVSLYRKHRAKVRRQLLLAHEEYKNEQAQAQMKFVITKTQVPGAESGETVITDVRVATPEEVVAGKELVEMAPPAVEMHLDEPAEEEAINPDDVPDFHNYTADKQAVLLRVAHAPFGVPATVAIADYPADIDEDDDSATRRSKRRQEQLANEWRAAGALIQDQHLLRLVIVDQRDAVVLKDRSVGAVLGAPGIGLPDAEVYRRFGGACQISRLDLDPTPDYVRVGLVLTQLGVLVMRRALPLNTIPDAVKAPAKPKEKPADAK